MPINPFGKIVSLPGRCPVKSSNSTYGPIPDPWIQAFAELNNSGNDIMTEFEYFSFI